MTTKSILVARFVPLTPSECYVCCRTMTAICFVCNLPILSHQVGLVWQGGNGWDDLVREQVEESTLRQRLGAGRRDSAAQITSISPPTETQETSPPSSGIDQNGAVNDTSV